MQNIDIICHQAAMTSVPRSMTCPLFYHNANVTGFINILEAAREKGIKRIVYVNIRVRSIDSLVTYTPPLGTPYNEILSFTLRYWDVYNDMGINGTKVGISAALGSIQTTRSHTCRRQSRRSQRGFPDGPLRYA
jgi:hypothetical protein